MRALRMLLWRSFATALVAAGCHGSSSAPNDTHGSSLPGIKMATSTEARAVVDNIKLLRSLALPVTGARKSRRPAPLNVAVLRDSDADATHNDGTAIRAHFRDAASAVAVTYPPTNDGKRTLALKSGGTFTLDVPGGSAATPAEYANGYLVYRSQSGRSGDTLVRPTREGFEDYFFFDRQPSSSTIEYTMTLPPSVAGLRLSSDVLELVDVEGIPLVHASPPFLVDSAGKTTRATVSVAGCAVDQSTQPSWHRRPTPPGATSCRVSISWPSASVHYPAVLDPTWQTAATMPITGTFSNTAVLGTTPQQIVVFGFFDGSTPLNTTLFFDVDSTTWSVGPPTVVARSGGTSVSFNMDNTNGGARVFVSGGETLGADGQWSYDTSTETLSLDAAGNWAWKASARMQTARALHTATAIPTPTGTKILLAGGIGAGPYTNGCDPGPAATAVDLYDPAADAFVNPPPPNLPAPLWGATAALSSDRQATVILSGYNGQTWPRISEAMTTGRAKRNVSASSVVSTTRDPASSSARRLICLPSRRGESPPTNAQMSTRSAPFCIM